ncbi:unnamed protein product, partial [Prorocentrum cordatum]
ELGRRGWGSLAPRRPHVLWSVATLRVSKPELVMRLCLEALGKPAEFNAQDISNTSWALATLAVQHRRLAETLCGEAVGKCPDFTCQGLANTLWAMATLKVRHPRLEEAFCQEASSRHQLFKPQEVANTLWAAATLSAQSPELWRCFVTEARAKRKGVTYQGIANTLWAMATVRVQQPLAVRDLCAELSAPGRDLDLLCSQAVANVLWAVVTMQEHHPQLLRWLCLRAEERLGSFGAHGLSSVLWAAAAARYQHAGLVQRVCETAALHVADFTPQGLANVLWSLTAMRAQQAGFTEALLAQAALKIDRFNAQDVASTLWSLASDQHGQHPELVRRLSGGSPERAEVAAWHHTGLWGGRRQPASWDSALLRPGSPSIREALAKHKLFNCQDMANTLWAVAALRGPRKDVEFVVGACVNSSSFSCRSPLARDVVVSAVADLSGKPAPGAVVRGHVGGEFVSGHLRGFKGRSSRNGWDDSALGPRVRLRCRGTGEVWDDSTLEPRDQLRTNVTGWVWEVDCMGLGPHGDFDGDYAYAAACTNANSCGNLVEATLASAALVAQIRGGLSRDALLQRIVRWDWNGTVRCEWGSSPGRGEIHETGTWQGSCRVLAAFNEALL